MATTTFASTPVRVSWRDRIHITRMTIFSLLFIALGAWLVLGGSRSIASATTTKLTFGTDLPDILVPTLAYALVVGVLYALGGIIGLIPGEDRALRIVRWVWLFVNGVLVIPTVLIIAAAGNSTNVTVMLQVSLTLAMPI